MVDKLSAWTERLSLIAVWCGGLMLLAAALLISAEVLMRKLFGVSTGGADELSSYAFAISTSWAFSLAVLRKAHVRVDVVYVRLGRSMRAYLDMLALLCLMVFAIFLSFHVVLVWSETLTLSATSNTILSTPLWLPQGLWICGFILFSWTLLLLSVKCAAALIAGKPETVHTLAGSRAAADELTAAAGGTATGTGG